MISSVLSMVVTLIFYACVLEGIVLYFLSFIAIGAGSDRALNELFKNLN